MREQNGAPLKRAVKKNERHRQNFFKKLAGLNEALSNSAFATHPKRKKKGKERNKKKEAIIERKRTGNLQHRTASLDEAQAKVDRAHSRKGDRTGMMLMLIWMWMWMLMLMLMLLLLMFMFLLRMHQQFQLCPEK